MLLKEHGWNVLSSGSGHQGVIRFSQEEVDAVVVDLNGGAEAALITGELKRLRPEIPSDSSDDRRESGEGSHPAGECCHREVGTGRQVGRSAESLVARGLTMDDLVPG